MPLFSSKLQLTNAASSSGVALSDIQFTRGAFYSVESYSQLVDIPVDRISNDQIIWVESSSATYQATYFTADYITVFADSASWAPFNGFGGGSSTLLGLSDVSGSATDGQVLQYDSASGNWVPNTISGVGGDITAVFTSDEGIIGGATSGNVVLELVGGDGVTIDSTGINVNTGSSHFTSGVTGVVNISSLNTFTGSIQTEVDTLTAATSSYIQASQTSSMTVLSASYAVSSSHEIITELSSSHAVQADSASYVTDAFISESALRSGFGTTTDISSLNTYTGSADSRLASLEAATSSYATGSHTSIAALNTFSGSIQTQVNSLEAATGSYIQASQTSSMTVLSASYAISASVEILTEISSSHAQQADTASFISDTFISESALRSGFGNIDPSIFALTGSDYATTNNIQITGSLTLQLDTAGDTLAIYSGSDKRFSITNEGILRLTTQSSTPTAVKGGMYLDSNYDLYIGQE